MSLPRLQTKQTKEIIIIKKIVKHFHSDGRSRQEGLTSEQRGTDSCPRRVFFFLIIEFSFAALRFTFDYE